MSKTYLSYEPDQQLLLPAALQEWLPDDHQAYFISDVVDQLDMSEVTARYERERRGGPPYHPRMMVKVLLYGYCKVVITRGCPTTRPSVNFHRYRVAHHPRTWRKGLPASVQLSGGGGQRSPGDRGGAGHQPGFG